MDFVEDDDLARAIALSMQEAHAPRRDVITIDSDDEEPADEDDDETRFQAELKRALEASQAEAARHAPAHKASPSPPPQPIPRIGALLFLSERAQLEKERRERQKRLRKQAGLGGDSDSDSNGKRSRTRSQEGEGGEEEEEEPLAKRQHLHPSSSARVRTDASSAGRANSAASSSTAGPSKTVPTVEQVFWDGELRQTATQHAEPRADKQPTFRLTEVLGPKSDLAFAILSSYALDFPWIYEFFDPAVPVIMVAQPDAQGTAGLKYVLPNWIKTMPPLRNGFGCQHMKFMLLFYKTSRLRIVISTANLIAYDWRDMENTVWLQDLPLRPTTRTSSTPNPSSKAPSDEFPSTLQWMLNSVNVRPALASMIMDNHPDLPIKSIEDLRAKWDWSKVKAHLVASIAGRHEGWPAVIKTGHPRLMTAVRKMRLRTGQGGSKRELVLECQGSSIGAYTTQWMNEFHYSARGESAEDWLDKQKKTREKLPYPPIRVVFPTKTTVGQSANGERGGGTIFCRRKQWAAKNFPRDLFYDSKSKAGPVLMHSKMIIGTMQDKKHSPHDSDTEDDDSDDEIQVIDPAIGWAYVGSHNFTPSAWGTLSGSGFNPVLNISNYEVGVVFPLKDKKDADRVACFQRLPKKYTSKDEPWIQEESVYHQQD